MKKFVQWTFFFLLTLSLAACGTTRTSTTAEEEELEVNVVQPAEKEDGGEEKGSVEGGQQYTAVISVKGYGDITLVLDEGIAPVTVANFKKLADEGFYDGLTFHRIIDGFMIQGGDPNGNGSGGSEETIYGEFASNGFNNTLKHTRGVISMARSAKKNSGSSQFFIVDEDAEWLDGEYAAFGWVVDGMDVVDAITADANPTDDNGTIPADEQPVITSITVTELDA